MKKLKPIFHRTVLAALVAGIFQTGCGGGSDSSSHLTAVPQGQWGNGIGGTEGLIITDSGAQLEQAQCYGNPTVEAIISQKIYEDGSGHFNVPGVLNLGDAHGPHTVTFDGVVTGTNMKLMLTDKVEGTVQNLSLTLGTTLGLPECPPPPTNTVSSP